DAVVIPSAVDLPAPSGGPPGIHREPRGRVRKAVALARGLAHTLSKDDKVHHEAPQANFPPIEARWYALSRSDGATVTTAADRGRARGGLPQARPRAGQGPVRGLGRGAPRAVPPIPRDASPLP